jgi:hypothetical protein
MKEDKSIEIGHPSKMLIRANEISIRSFPIANFEWIVGEKTVPTYSMGIFISMVADSFESLLRSIEDCEIDNEFEFIFFPGFGDEVEVRVRRVDSLNLSLNVTRNHPPFSTSAEMALDFLRQLTAELRKLADEKIKLRLLLLESNPELFLDPVIEEKDTYWDYERDVLMSGAEWVVSEIPGKMIACLREKTSDRKMRLITCAFARLAWHRFDFRQQEALRLAEEFADGKLSNDMIDNLRKTFEHSFDPSNLLEEAFSPEGIVRWTLNTGERGTSYPPSWAAFFTARNLSAFANVSPISLCNAIRDIVRNPFELNPPINLDWITPKVLGIAKSFYSSRDLHLFFEMEGALLEAGCDDPAILTHCRDNRVHYHGCWLIDKIMGIDCTL